MNKKLFLTPLIILGYLFFILGIAWLIVDEPWMLDKVANEERIGMTFEKLFSEDINKSLPGYLKQIYRFFGLWVSIIGLFIIGFSKDRFTEDKSIRKTLLFCVGFTVYSALILAYKFLPSSPFIYVGWGGVFLHLISVLNHRKLN
tara:strand:- start:1118 stop:1552 length:435 start_codon:yes stop_codon:yes gene_type:complete